MENLNNSLTHVLAIITESGQKYAPKIIEVSQYTDGGNEKDCEEYSETHSGVVVTAPS